MVLRACSVILVLHVYAVLVCLSPKILRGTAAKGRCNPGIRVKTTLNRSTGEKSVEENQSGWLDYTDTGVSQHS